MASCNLQDKCVGVCKGSETVVQHFPENGEFWPGLARWRGLCKKKKISFKEQYILLEFLIPVQKREIKIH